MAAGIDEAGEVEIVGTARVLRDEFSLLWPDDPNPPGDGPSYGLRAGAKVQTALCLSGGGLRSAAFGLGVLQGLSAAGLLTRFHYLSAVSGGAHIAAWLQRLMLERGDSTEAIRTLGGESGPPEVSALRENFRCAGDRAVAGSQDGWTRTMVLLRNITANWLLLGAVLVAAVLLPRLVFLQLDSSVFRSALTPLVTAIPLAACAFAAAVAMWKIVRSIPGYRAAVPELRRDGARSDSRIMTSIVTPTMIWAIGGTLSLAIDAFNEEPLLILSGLALVAASVAGAVTGLLAAGLARSHESRLELLDDLPLWIAVSLLWAGTILLGATALDGWISDVVVRILHERPIPYPDIPPHLAAVYYWHRSLPPPSPLAMLTVLGPPWLILTGLLAQVLFVVLRKRHGRETALEADAEWLAVLSGMQVKPALLWALAAFATLLLLPMLRLYPPEIDLSLSGALALATGAVAVLGGKAGSEIGSHPLLRYLPLRPVVALATAVSAGLLILLPVLIAEGLVVLTGRAGKFDYLLPPWTDAPTLALFAVEALLLLLVLILGRRIDLTRFSLTWAHRNRLSQVFLGSARRERWPDPISGFDPFDDVALEQVGAAAAKRRFLYPVINATLNTTARDPAGGRRPITAPFIFSPLYSGSSNLTPPDPRNSASADGPSPGGAFVPSASYAGEPDLPLGGTGVSLATAAILSGAADDRQSGYHPSPITSFLMTIFSARLGAWLPNPAAAGSLGAGIARATPSNSVRALMGSLLGAADARELELFISDGGHFDNLGLYEMIRRRCRFIMVSDAGADPDSALEDLGAAIRRVKIDFGVQIVMRPGPAQASVLGDIFYPEGPIGRLLYLKPKFPPDSLPVDVEAYAKRNKDFPNETGDRFFSEAQFESYRELGRRLTAEALRDRGWETPDDPFEGLSPETAPKTRRRSPRSRPGKSEGRDPRR